MFIKPYSFTTRVLSLIILCLIMAMAGCASLPKFDVPPTARIGIISLLENEVTHTHIGTTIATNFIDKYPVDWNLSEIISSKFEEQIQLHTDMKVVRIMPTALLEKEKKNLLAGWSGVTLNAVLVPEFENIAKEYNIDLFFIISSFVDDDYKGGSGKSIEGYGLYTRTFLMVNALAYPYANIQVDAFWAHPPTYTAGYRYFMSNDEMPKDMELPLTGNLRDISISEIDKLKPLMTADLDKMVQKALKSANVIKEE